MSRTVPNHPGLYSSSSGLSSHCYKVVEVDVGVAVAVGVGVGLGLGVGLGDGLGLGLGDGEGDADVADGRGLAGADDWTGTTFVWCAEGVGDAPSELGEPHGLASPSPGETHLVGDGLSGRVEVGVFTSSTDVPLVVPVDLFSRLPLR